MESAGWGGMRTKIAAFLSGRWMGVVAVAGLVFMPLAASGDDGSAGGALLSGMYKVAASNDPLFPERERLEWFLDFGEGQAAGRTSGKLAVSMRENPRVRVRILVWQVFGGGNLKIGAQTHEGSKQAVTVADWAMMRTATGMVLQRGGYEVRLLRADPADY